MSVGSLGAAPCAGVGQPSRPRTTACKIPSIVTALLAAAPAAAQSTDGVPVRPWFRCVTNSATGTVRRPATDCATEAPCRASTADAYCEVLSIELSTFEDELRFERDSVG